MIKFIEALKTTIPDNHIQYQLLMDPGKTGNFEVTKFDDAALSGDGVAIWSKQEKGAFPMANENDMSTICEALK